MPALFVHYGITKQDIVDVLIELYGKANYDKYCHGKMKPFYVYELPEELDKAVEDYSDLLSSWNQNVPIDHTYEPLWRPGKGTELFDKFLNSICEAYDIHIWHGTDDELSACWKAGELPDFARKTVLDVRAKLGVKTADEVLHDDEAWLFVHFDDNEVWNLAETSDCCEADICEWTTEADKEEYRKSALTTKAYTLERVFEVLLRKLVEKGKIKVDDLAVLSKAYPYCADSKDKAQGTWLEGDKYKPADMVDEVCLHANMHEG